MFNGSNGYSLADIAAATTGNGMNNGWGNGFGGDGWWILLFLLALGGGWGNGGWGGNGNNGTTAVVGREVSYGFDMNNLENGIRGIQNGLCDGFYAMNTGLLNSTAQLQSTMAQGFGGVTSAIAASDVNTQRGFTDAAIANLHTQYGITGAIKDLNCHIDSCCCDIGRQIERGFADTNYRMATEACDTRRAIYDSTKAITDNTDAGIRAILQFLTDDKIETLQAENQALKFAQSQSNQNAFLIGQLTPRAIPAYIAPNPYTGVYGGYGGVAYGCGSNYGVNYNSCGC